MPGAVLEWFKRQKDVLFYYGPISSMKDIELASRKCLGVDSFPDYEGPYQLRDLLFQLMLKQQDYLDEQNVRHDNLLFHVSMAARSKQSVRVAIRKVLMRTHDTNVLSHGAT